MLIKESLKNKETKYVPKCSKPPILVGGGTMKGGVKELIDENILEIIRKYLVVKDTEKKLFGEVFTPTDLVNYTLDKFNSYSSDAFSGNKTFCDTMCGDGQFLYNILMRKVKNGVDFETALSTIYGVELIEDNVALCRKRLLCGREDLTHIVKQNIVCADALKYHYRFDNSDPYKIQNNVVFDSLFAEV